MLATQTIRQRETNMQTIRMRYSLIILAIFFFPLIHAGSISITYDKNKQLLGVTADQASLTEILKQISIKTGIAIRIDPAIERTASFTLKPGPVDKTLRRVAKNLSYVIQYDRKNKTRRVTNLDILPKGKQDSANLITLRPATIRNKQRSVIGGSSPYAPKFIPADPEVVKKYAKKPESEKKRTSNDQKVTKQRTTNSPQSSNNKSARSLSDSNVPSLSNSEKQ